MGREWRCTSCQKLLGVLEGARLSIRFARGYSYDVSLPVRAKCWRCGEVNELSQMVKEAWPRVAGSCR